MTRALLGAGATVLAAGRSAERLVELAKRLDAAPIGSSRWRWA
jgi:NADP-dependent 3-hydroxy acid dehydrogenase YdfG